MASCISIEDIESWEYVDEAVVYDISVEMNTNYYLAGEQRMLVHNSGKTYSTLQFLFVKAITTPKIVITIVAQDIPNLKKGALRDALKIFSIATGLKDFLNDYNKTDRIFTFKNGAIIEFVSFQDEQDARGGRRDILYVNEANGISYQIYWQLSIRTSTKIIVDYNPTSSFWAHHEVIPLPNAELVISDHRHNPFLSEELHNQIEGIKDKDLWKVYARGMTGILKGTIYPNWTEVPDDFFTFSDGVIWGIDYEGTSNRKDADPTAVDRIAFKPANCEFDFVIDRALYGKGATSDIIESAMRESSYKEGQPVYCDHNGVATTHELRQRGIWAVPAIKGPKLPGILFLRKYKIAYTARCVEKKEELKNYKFMEIEGILTNIPIDGWDHCFTGETKIFTENGEKPICEISSGDSVMTSNGFRPVRKRWNNGLKQICNYTLQLGTFSINLRCTSDHLIKTTQGWVRISQLQSGMTVYLSSHLMAKRTSCTREGDILPDQDTKCIGMCGSTSTAKGVKASTFITLTKIPGIISQIILSLSKDISTFQHMSRKGLKKTLIFLKNFSERESRPLLFGTPQKKETSGINSMPLKQFACYMKGILKKNVFSARKDILPQKSIKTGLDSAQTDANLLIEENRGLTTKRGSAQCVAPHSMLANMQKLHLVVELVLQRIDGTPEGPEDVYDLEIDGVHEYFANGLLVHNSLDADRYGIYSHALRSGDI